MRRHVARLAPAFCAASVVRSYTFPRKETQRSSSVLCIAACKGRRFTAESETTAVKDSLGESKPARAVCRGVCWHASQGKNKITATPQSGHGQSRQDLCRSPTFWSGRHPDKCLSISSKQGRRSGGGYVLRTTRRNGIAPITTVRVLRQLRAMRTEFRSGTTTQATTTYASQLGCVRMRALALRRECGDQAGGSLCVHSARVNKTLRSGCP